MRWFMDWLVISLLLLFGGAVLDADAAQAEYDASQVARQRAFVQLYVQTVKCFLDGTQAALKYGNKDTNEVKLFVITICGRPLGNLLARDNGWTQEQIETILDRMAAEAIAEFKARRML